MLKAYSSVIRRKTAQFERISWNERHSNKAGTTVFKCQLCVHVCVCAWVHSDKIPRVSGDYGKYFVLISFLTQAWRLCCCAIGRCQQICLVLKFFVQQECKMRSSLLSTHSHGFNFLWTFYVSNFAQVKFVRKKLIDQTSGALRIQVGHALSEHV